MQAAWQLPIGARGRVVEVPWTGPARAVIEGRSVLVVSARGGPFSCGDAVRIVAHRDGRALVDVRNVRATYPVLLNGWARRWMPLPVR